MAFLDFLTENFILTLMDKEIRDITEIIEAINQINLNKSDLLNACIEFSKIYFKKDKIAEAQFDKFWDNNFFKEQACISAKEAIVLALNAITLSKDIDFKEVVNRCIDIDKQKSNEHTITMNVKEQNDIHLFLTDLRNELFTRIYAQNKGFQKISKLSIELLDERYNIFLNKKF